MIGLVLTAAGFALLALVGLKGRPVDRWAVAVLVISVLATPLVETPVWQNIRWAVATLDVVVFITLFGLANLDDRWWLINISSLQLLNVTTHFAPAIGLGEYHIGTFVTFRILLWGVFIITFVAAIAEIEIDRRYRSIAHDIVRS